MKIAIPVDEKSLTSSVCASFGRAPFFLIYDTDTKESSFVDNTAAASAGGAGIKAAQLIVDSNANVLITFRCGINAANVLKGANIALYKAELLNAKENIDAFAAGSLPLLDDIHAGFHGGNR